MREFAIPLPMTVICELLGVPPADHDRVLDWTQVIRTSGSTSRPPREERAAVQEAQLRLHHYLADLVRAKRDDPADDIIGALDGRRRRGPDAVRGGAGHHHVPAAVRRAPDHRRLPRQRGAGAAHPPRTTRPAARHAAPAAHRDRGTAAVRRPAAGGQPAHRHRGRRATRGYASRAARSSGWRSTRPTTTRTTSPTPTGSTCAGPGDRTWASATACTTASASRWPGWRRCSRSPRCCAGCPGCGSPSRPPRCAGCPPPRRSAACWNCLSIRL